MCQNLPLLIGQNRQEGIVVVKLLIFKTWIPTSLNLQWKLHIGSKWKSLIDNREKIHGEAGKLNGGLNRIQRGIFGSCAGGRRAPVIVRANNEWSPQPNKTFRKWIIEYTQIGCTRRISVFVRYSESCSNYFGRVTFRWLLKKQVINHAVRWNVEISRRY